MHQKDVLYVQSCLLLLAVLYPAANTQVTWVDLCGYDPEPITTTGGLSLEGEVTYLVSQSAISSFTSPWPTLGAADSIQGNGVRVWIKNVTTDSTIAVPDVIITKTLEIYDSVRKPPEVLFKTELLHTVNSPENPISDVTLTEDLYTGMMAELGSGFVPGIFAANLTHNARVSITWFHTSVASNDSRVIEYRAEPPGTNGIDLPVGISSYTSSISFTDTNGYAYGPIEITVCINRIDKIVQSVFYLHGLTAMTFFLAMLLGVIIVILVFCIIIRFLIKRGKWTKSVSPTDERKMLEKGRKIMMDPKAAMKRGQNTIQDFSMLGMDDSIVMVLGLKDKLQMFREVDNMDILSTINVEQELETEQYDAATQASVLLVQGLVVNNDITKQTEDRVISDFNNRLKKNDKSLAGDYRKELEEVYADLSAKNKEKYGELMLLHRKQRAEAEQATQDIPDEEKKSYLKVLEQEQQTEENELTYILALEQNEAAEKLRKEYAIRKRMGGKEIQQQLLDETVALGQLGPEQAEWLLKEHKKQQEAIHKLYDEEISTQRMILEEKLAKRKGLALTSESQEDDHTDVLNTMASHQLTAINKMKRQGVLEDYEAQELKAKVTQELLDVEARRKAQKEREEAELHKRLSEKKRQRLAEKRNDKEYQKTLAMLKQKLSEMKRENQADRSVQVEVGNLAIGAVDPVSHVESLLRLTSQHRSELSALENEIDEEQAKELEEVRNTINENAKKELEVIEENLLTKLTEGGMTETQVDKILKQHKKDMSELEVSQQENREKQSRKLQEDLAKRKYEWEQRKAQEKNEQEELREHETKLANKLINSQVSISEEERNRIMKEHEMQMVKLENSLTLSKLRQKRMLEDRLSQRRAQQMEELKREQEAEKRRKSSRVDDSVDEEENHSKKVMLLKKHAEQKIAVLQGQKLNLDDELEQIQSEMIKERAMALREQEERLGAMITALQMERARELSKIEEQQTAINNLKANLVDDLTDRGILTSPECEQIISRHKQEQDRLNKNLEAQRMKQEQSMQTRLYERRVLKEESFVCAQKQEMDSIGQLDTGYEVLVGLGMRQKLSERLQQREKTLIQKQEREMQAVINASTNKTASKIRKTMLMHNQMLELERFRNQADREVSQFLEDMRRQYEVNKLRKIQEQELQFISGLVKVGSFQKEDLVHVLQMLFPGKTSEDIKEMLEKIYNEKEAAALKSQHPESQPESPKSHLSERVHATQAFERRMSRQNSSLNLLGSRSSPKKRVSSGRRRISSPMEIGDYENGGPVPYRSLNTKPGYENRAYEEDYMLGRSLKRDSLSSHHNQSVSEDDYYKHKQTYDEVDFIGMGANAGLEENNSQELGRKLPPLPKSKRKKKSKLLARLAHHRDEEELL